jgi:hypothetical protein
VNGCFLTLKRTIPIDCSKNYNRNNEKRTAHNAKSNEGRDRGQCTYDGLAESIGKPAIDSCTTFVSLVSQKQNVFLPSKSLPKRFRRLPREVLSWNLSDANKIDSNSWLYRVRDARIEPA